jgi:hypothetical protein
VTREEPVSKQEELGNCEAEMQRPGEDEPLFEAEGGRFVGAYAIDPDSNELGVVQDLIIDAAGRVQGVVLDVGSLQGQPEHRVSIDWNEIAVSGDDRLVIDMSQQEIQPRADLSRRD